MKYRIFFLCTALALSFAGQKSAAQSIDGPSYKKSDITRVALLGTGTPRPDPDRFGPAIAIIVNDTPYLIDAGIGVVRRASALSSEYGGPFDALESSNLTTVFLTHLHSDHTMGLIDLIKTPWHTGRTKPLTIIGPEGAAEMAEHLQKAYRRDRELRLYGAQPANNTGWRTVVHEHLTSGVVYEDNNVKVEAIATDHGSWPVAFAYKFTTPDREILISGDTVYNESIEAAAKGIDILIHEVYGLENFAAGVPLFQSDLPRWQAYMADFHTSTRDLARLASNAKPGLLILYHEIAWSDDPDSLVKEIKQYYSGAVVSGKDLDVY